MTPLEASRLLDLPADATPEQLEARFLELRTRLEEKIGKAPTPGLKAKYRESLDELTQAFETLTLAADSSALPVLKKEMRDRRSEMGRNPSPASQPHLPSPISDLRTRTPSLRRGGKEFAFVAVIAVLVLAAGGWWVMKTRAENAEQARLAAEAKAEADRQAEATRLAAEEKKKSEEEQKLRLAAAEKFEAERLTKQQATLKSRLAELNLAYDAVVRSEALAERELADLKSELRSISRESANTEARRQLERKIVTQTAYLAWLRETLPTHPASVHRARAASLLESRSIDEAAEAIKAYTLANQQLRKDQAAALAYTGEVPEKSSAALVTSTDPRILRRGTLDYPPTMLRREMEGLARISCVVQPDGKPTDLQIVEATTPEFGNAALKYVATFTFAPATDAGGKAIALKYVVPVRFKLN